MKLSKEWLRANAAPLAVAVFIFLLLFAEISWGAPKHSFDVGLTAGVLNSKQVITQRLGYTRDNKWQFTYERFGGRGNTVDADSVAVFRKVTTTQVRFIGTPWIGIGAQYFFDRPVAGDTGEVLVSEDLTFKLGLGTSWQLSRDSSVNLGWYHNSTAGRSKRNHGIDRVVLAVSWGF